MRITTRSDRVALVILAVAACNLGRGQTPPPSVLEIDVENVVTYSEDTSEFSKFASVPGVTTPASPKNFGSFLFIGDIVAVNGRPVKGTFVNNQRRVNLTPNPSPGQAIADVTRSNVGDQLFEILNADGTIIGTIVTLGLQGAGTPPPGSPLKVTTGNNVIIGGTGAFLGVRGQSGQTPPPQNIAFRNASMTEDPANRRINGGGTARFVQTVIPMSVPQIVVTAGGPAVTHSSDFTLVTASRPAEAGEILSLFVTGLGATRPGVDPGKPFPSSPPQVVSAPVEVTVNGKSAEVLGAVGFPGAVDGYQVNFRFPSDVAKGPATIQVSAAWITGPGVSIATQ
jgi:uncharacterized protein (TIGR03437 family)